MAEYSVRVTVEYLCDGSVVASGFESRALAPCDPGADLEAMAARVGSRVRNAVDQALVPDDAAHTCAVVNRGGRYHSVPRSALVDGDEVAYIGTVHECSRWAEFMALPKHARCAPGAKWPEGYHRFRPFTFRSKS